MRNSVKKICIAYGERAQKTGKKIHTAFVIGINKSRKYSYIKYWSLVWRTKKSSRSCGNIVFPSE
jgi:hypothetical protein